ncbi:MAG: Fic family protein [Planctomycetes bacterium]|nr:Fic family protein [Planctomycetota bacterium]
MKVEQFAEARPGRIIPIMGDEHAFVPDQLPPDWEFPNGLWPLLAEAKHQIGILEGLGRNLPNPGILLRPLEDREAIRSSSLEGTYATPKELLLFELAPRESLSEGDPANDQREVFNYRLAFHHGTQSSLPLSLRLLKEMHEILLRGVRGKDRAPGEFRKIQVAIGSTRRFVPPPPEQVMTCLDALEKYFHQAEPKFDALVECFLVHYQFETIHPFNDGNGRVGRLLLALMLQQRCEMSKPWLYLSEYFDRYRDEYVQHLFHVSTHANWSAWVEFCLNATITQAKETIERCERMLAIREDFSARLVKVGGNVRLNQIVESIFHSPFVQVADLAKKLSVTYPTAKSDLERLASAGILQELPGAQPRTYYAPEVFNIAYESLTDD